MASRASLYPNSKAGSTATTAHFTKQRQVAQLAERLAKLSNRVVGLDKQVVTASEQAEKLKDLAGMHAALYVAQSKRLDDSADWFSKLHGQRARSGTSSR